MKKHIHGSLLLSVAVLAGYVPAPAQAVTAAMLLEEKSADGSVQQKQLHSTTVRECAKKEMWKGNKPFWLPSEYKTCEEAIQLKENAPREPAAGEDTHEDPVKRDYCL